MIKRKSLYGILLLLLLVIIGVFLFFNNGIRLNKIKAFLIKGPVYLLKRQRENLTSVFVFGNYDRSLWHLTLSKKRLVEAKQLFQLEEFSDSVLFNERSIRELDTASKFFQIAKASGEDVNYLEKEIKDLNLEQKNLIKRVGELKF